MKVWSFELGNDQIYLKTNLSSCFLIQNSKLSLVSKNQGRVVSIQREKHILKQRHG